MEQIKKKRLFYGWVNLVVLWFVYLLFAVPLTYAVGVIMKDMASDLGMTMFAAMFAYSAHSVLSALISPVLGWFSTRYGAKPSLLLGLGAAVLGCAAFAFLVQGKLSYYLAWILFFSVAMRFGALTSCQITISKWFFHRRGLAMALFFTSGGIGGYLLSPILAAIHRSSSWRGVWLFLMCTSAAAFLLVLLLLKEAPADAGQQIDNGAAPAPAKTRKNTSYKTTECWTVTEAMRSWQFYLIVLLFIASQFVMYAVSSSGLEHLVSKQIPRDSASTAIGMFALISTAGRLLVGVFSDRFNTRIILGLGSLLGIAGMALMALTATIGQSVFALLMMGLGYGIIFISPTTMLLDYFGTHDYPKITSWYSLIGGCISALSSAIYGFLYDATGSYDLVWVLGGALFLLCLAISAVITPPRRQSFIA